MGRGKALHLERYPSELPKEDRLYGGNDFYVDLVPRSVWWANLRVMLSPSQWKFLSKYVIQRAGAVCEICGSTTRLEAHERWDFDKRTGIQRLVRIVCMCKLCHLSIHIGLARVLGIREDIDAHIFSLTMWGKREMKHHIKEARERWDELSHLAWTADVSIVIDAGFTPYGKEEIWRRVNEKRCKINEKRNSTCLVIDGLAWEFSDQVFNGCVVFIADEDEETLNGLPLTAGAACVEYTAKLPELINPYKPRLDLKTFISAFRRPFAISNNAELKSVLLDHAAPKRLIVTDEVDVTREMIDREFSQGTLFWSTE